MNAREKFNAVMRFEKHSPVPKVEYGYWVGTIKRFIKEGMPVVEILPQGISDNGSIMGYTKAIPTSGEVSDRNVSAYFGLDSYISKFPFDISPMLKEIVIEEDEHTRLYKDKFGITKKARKDGTSAPLELDFPIKCRKDFEKYKTYYDASCEKCFPGNWAKIKEDLLKREFPLRIGGFPYGFLGFPRHLMGVTNYFMMMYDDPQLIKDFNDFFLSIIMNSWSELFKDLEVDCCLIFEDMAYKSGSLISPEMFKEFMTPYYIRLVDFLKHQGIKNILVDSDGFIEEIIPLWVEVGITGLLPFEIQAGNNLLRIRERFPKLQLLGGIDKKILAEDKLPADIDAELAKVKPLLDSGGYIPHIDHHVSEDSCWKNFKYYRERLNEIIDRFS